MTGEPLYFSILIPTCESAGAIQRCVAGVCEVLETCIPQRYELIFVDTDEATVRQAARELTIEFPQLRIVESSPTRVLQGWSAANGNVVGSLDGNLEKTPHTLSTLIEQLESGADFALLGEYGNDTTQSEPSFSCLAIKRERLYDLQHSDKGTLLLEKALGKESIDQIRSHFNSENGTLTKWRLLAESIYNMLGK